MVVKWKVSGKPSHYFEIIMDEVSCATVEKEILKGEFIFFKNVSDWLINSHFGSILTPTG